MSSKMVELHKKQIEDEKNIYKSKLKYFRNTVLLTYFDSTKAVINNMVSSSSECSIEIFEDDSFLYNLTSSILDTANSSIEKTNAEAKAALEKYQKILLETFNYYVDMIESEINSLLKNGVLVTDRFHTEALQVPEDLCYTLIETCKLEEYKEELMELKNHSLDELKNINFKLPLDFMTESYIFLDYILNEICNSNY